ncbi:MAG: DUF4340 domain-containing protein [Acidobacteria bacterium]|nr:DUF4340 domain-containing protein [Acidobacteriota bacterium]
MKKKYLHTLIAAAVLAALVGAAAYWEKRKAAEPAKPESTPSSERLFPVDAKNVQAFTVKNSETVTCQREGEGWKITAPKKLAADGSAIESLLTSLVEASVDQVVDSKPAALHDFGLDTPSVTVEVTTNAKPDKFTLSLGDETPTGGGVYAQAAGNPRVITVGSFLKTSLNKNTFDLRDKRIVSIPSGQVNRIEVVSKSDHWTLAKDPQGIWDLILPPAVRADRFTAEGIVSRIENGKMQSVVAEDKKNTGKYGFALPEVTIHVSGAGKTQTLTVGKVESGHYYAMNSGLDPVFTLDSGFLTDYQKKASDLRAKDLFTFSTFEVKRLEVVSPAGSRTFEKQAGSKWKQTAPAAKDVSTEKVEALLDKLRDLRAESFPGGEKLDQYGLTKPAYRFKTAFGDKNETETVEASKAGEHSYARRSTDILASEISKTALDEIDKALKEL